MVDKADIRILVVDDEPDVLSVVSDFLRHRIAHVEVISAEGGPEALRAIDKDPPDIVVTDYRMPEVDGVQVMRHAVAKGVAATMMLTAYPDVDVAIAALNEGHAARFFVKPPDPAALAQAVQEVVEDLRSGRTRATAFERARALALRSREEAGE